MMGANPSKKGSKPSPIPPDAKSLQDCGYHFVQDTKSDPAEFLLRMKALDGGEFKFQGQAHYEKLGDFVANEVAEIVETEFDLERVMLPLEQDRGRCPTTFPILHSKDLTTNSKIIILVLGAGKVELGQWSRSLCMNKSLAEGSLMPFIHEAMRVRGCAVLLTNPNINYYLNDRTKRLSRIPFNDSPEAHLHYLYDNFIKNTVAKEIAIIAHSFGGVSTMTLLTDPVVVDDFLGPDGRLKSVTFTDSVHGASMGSLTLAKPTRSWLMANAINFVRSQDPLGTRYTAQVATQRASAGTNDHASTSYACRTLLWQWIDARMGVENPPPYPGDAAATNEDEVDEIRKKTSRKKKSKQKPSQMQSEEDETTEQKSKNSNEDSNNEMDGDHKSHKRKSSKTSHKSSSSSEPATEEKTDDEKAEANGVGDSSAVPATSDLPNGKTTNKKKRSIKDRETSSSASTEAPKSNGVSEIEDHPDTPVEHAEEPDHDVQPKKKKKKSKNAEE